MKGTSLVTLAARGRPPRHLAPPTSAAPGALRGIAAVAHGVTYRF